MKIDDRISNYMSLLNREAIKPASQPVDISGARTIAEPASVAVALSSTAVQLADDVSRRERLHVIRQQLAEGSYNISGKDVANKILNMLKG